MKLKILCMAALLLGSIAPLLSECVLVPLSLNERVAAAELIVEARVEQKTSYRNSASGMIYTASSLKISRVYKGYEKLGSDVLQLITLGGTVGDKAIKVDPELETETGEIGIFMLIRKDGEWVSESGPQGIIRIDKHSAVASDVFHTWAPYTIQDIVQSITGIPVRNVNELLTKIVLSSKRAAPVLSSIAPKTLSSGTSTVLTIKGSNFKSSRDTGSVQFRNADDGGASYIKALNQDYVSWSDTMIRLIVRSKAGTGKIRVVVGGNGVAVSADTLKINYAHLNVVLGDTIGFETRQIGMNTGNGITWKMNKRFYDSSAARGAFIRSLERWRCGTYINWDTLGKVNYSTIKPDGVNICAWDTNNSMPSGVLAQCYSYWSGCYSPDLKWYVNELDIRFRIRPTGSTVWNYTTGNAGSGQFHFESVATHELGHGHQLGHVINSPVVMHYSIANGQTKPNLNASDVAAGNYVIGKSLTSVCGRNAHNKLTAGNCPIVAPKADFIASVSSACKNDNIVFTDTSAGNITSWLWDFGAGAIPANASTEGPHNVRYGSGGSKTVTLSISTIAGTLQKTRNLNISNDSKMLPDFAFTGAEKGRVSFSSLSNNSVSDVWNFGDAATSTLPNPVHNYAAGGTYQVKLKSSNACNTDSVTKAVRIVWLDFGTDKRSACIGEPVLYLDSGDNNAASWTWNFPGGNPASAAGKGPHRVSYNSAGSKQASLTVGVSGSQDQTYTRSNLISIGSDTFTRAAFSYSRLGAGLVVFNNMSSGSNKRYKWYFGDGDSSSQMNPVHLYAKSAGMPVRLLVSGNCGTDDTTMVLSIYTGLNEQANANAFRFFPNPSGGNILFELNGSEQAEVEITDISGRMLKTFTATNGERSELGALGTGIYLLKARFEDGSTVCRYLILE